MKILITGANGFVGEQLVLRGMNLPAKELLLLARDDKKIPGNLKHLNWLIRDINMLKKEDLQGVDVVIHTAAKAHDNRASDSEYEINNTQATRHLAECAAAAGVRRFIFISTLKVHGEYTLPDHPFHSSDRPNPCDSYARSKFAAEQDLQKVAGDKMDWVIIRPPLIYGKKITGNLQMLESLIRKKIPMPFAAIKNKRSVLAVDNLVDALWNMLTLENISRKILLLSDSKAVSTADIVRHIGKEIGVTPILLPLPDFILKFGCRILGREDIYIRTCMSLQVDDSESRKLLNWSPPFHALY